MCFRFIHFILISTAHTLFLTCGLALGNLDGMFLIRDSTSSANDYVVSVTHNGKVYHFQIKEIYKGHYQIDEGPIVHGKGDNQDK
jgi:hypothetical protein